MGITAPGLFARNCSVRRLDKASAAAFLDANHRMGRCKCRYCYGLFVDRTTGSREAAVEAGSLVAVASFSAGRTMRDGTRSFEWIRFASLRGLRVIGGMGKLLDAFVADHQPDDVMTYVDAAESDGSAYMELGFTREALIQRNGWTNLKLRKSFIKA